MARTIDIDKQIEHQEKKILKLKKQLEDAQKQHQRLIEEKKETDKKKLFAAYQKSRRSLDEVIDFLRVKADI
jgi:hypothetical protein